MFFKKHLTIYSLSPHNNQSKMPASSKHKYSKILAFPDTYYELVINLLQSVELFCAYYSTMKRLLLTNYFLSESDIKKMLSHRF